MPVAQPGRDSIMDDLKQRRERGKIAQRAFRQRQIDTIRGLKKENLRLRDAIRIINDASSGNNNNNNKNGGLGTAIVKARQLAGLDVQAEKASPGENMTDCSGEDSMRPVHSNEAHFGQVIPGCSDAVPCRSSDPIRSMPLRDSPDSSLTQAGLDELVHGDWSSGSSSDNQDRTQDQQAKDHLHSRSMSPRLDYGLWFEADRAVKFLNPPQDITAFMGPRAYSVSGQVLWGSLAMGYSALRAVAGEAPPSPEALSAAYDMFGNTLRLVPLRDLIDQLQVRLIYRRQGYMSGDHPGRNPEVPMRVFVRLLPLLVESGVRTEDYISPVAVEERLRDVMGAADYGHFEAALRGQGAPENRPLMRRTMRSLARVSQCFGNGPRWKLETVDQIAKTWVQGMQRVVVP